MGSVLENQLINAVTVHRQTELDSWADTKKQYENETKKFRKDFNPKKIKQMNIEGYAGTKHINDQSFCYRIERDLKVAGSISGSPNNRFGVYYSVKNKIYKATKQHYNEDVQTGLELIKTAILDLILLDKTITKEQYDQNILSTMFKNKILHVYHPDEYLSIYSQGHLYWLCKYLGMDDIQKHPYYAHRALLQYKRTHKDFKMLSNWEFGHLVYGNSDPDSDEYSYSNHVKNKSKKSKDKQNYNSNATFVDPYQVGQEFTRPKKRKSGKGEYTRTQLQNMKTGEKGEEIVFNELKKQWCTLDPEYVLDHKSLKDDTLGYDIYGKYQGEEYFIEVKSTVGKFESARFFITENEKYIAKEKEDRYFLYFVSEIDSEPKITYVQNPFQEPHPRIEMNLQSIKYQMSVKFH
ncbi:DUF3883 domain-containing protein [Marinicella sp. W31]|uniref:DUF3883 domain-containing protein n=1 Tax=Marinicella sp. W31 TaxID=3023713 RepID=UPI0037576057